MLGNVLMSLLVLAIIGYFALGLAIFALFSAREWGVFYYLSHYGELNAAEITNVNITKNRADNYFVEYHYYVGDMLYNGKQQISRKHYKQFQQQGYVTILYSLTKPNWSRLSKNDIDYTARNFSSIIALVVCGLCPPFIILWVAALVSTYLYLSFALGEKKKKRFKA